MGLVYCIWLGDEGLLSGAVLEEKVMPVLVNLKPPEV